MATYYVYSGAAGLNNGSSWTDAYTAFGSAVTAANASGDLIKVHKTHVENVAADTTYTFLTNVNVICVDKDAADALATMDGTSYYIGHNSTNYSVGINGTATNNIYLYGIAFKVAGVNAETQVLNGAGDGTQLTMENCKYLITNTSSTTRLYLGSNTTINTALLMKNCEISFGNASQGFVIGRGYKKLVGCVVSGTALTTMFPASVSNNAEIEFEGCDLSLYTGTIAGNMNQASQSLRFINCKLGAGVTAIAAQTHTNMSSVDVTFYNCSSGDTHYHLAHHNALGSTVIDTGIYANDGASFDGGTTRTTWKISTTSAASYWSPYVSPWFDKYHTGTSAITPYIEILRDGSTTAYQDDEVWGEWSIQATTGSVLPVFKNDRMAPLGTPADQTAGVGLAGWTGESGTAWSGKLVAPSSTTPAEIGYLRARVCVGEPSVTVYVDPTIRT